MPKIPPEGRRFAPGNNANPLGAAAHNKDLKRVRSLTKEQVAEIGSIILENNLEKLLAIREKKNSSVLKVWFAAVAIKSISRGDAHALSVILDRIVGKPKDIVELSGKDGGPIHSVSEDQVKAAIAKAESEF